VHIVSYFWKISTKFHLKDTIRKAMPRNAPRRERVLDDRTKGPHGLAATSDRRDLRYGGRDWRGTFFLPVAALADPVTRAAGFALIQFAVWAFADADIADGLNGGGLAALTRFVGMAVVTVCVVPIVAVASIGEIGRVHVPWYAGATGLAAASAPWLIRAALHLPRAAGYNFAELRLALFSSLPA
jgi:hypothetical protein